MFIGSNDVIKEMFSNDNPRLGNENIRFQHGNPLPGELVKYFDEIIDIVKSRSITGSSIGKHRQIKRIIRNIDDSIYRHVGIITKHVHTTKSPYGVYTIAPTNYNVVGGDFEERQKQIDEYLKAINYGSSRKTLMELNDAEADINEILSYVAASTKAIDAAVSSNGIRVDLEHARVSNWPKDATVFIRVSLDLLINRLKLTSGEITAILLHEIGHQMTHLEYSIRTIHHTAVIIDSIHDTINNKNGTFRKSIDIAYENMGGNLSDIEGASDVTATVRLIDLVLKDAKVVEVNTHHVTNSEQLADQFAVRFGMGSELVSALHKFNNYKENIVNVSGVVNVAVKVLIMVIKTIILAAIIIAGLTVSSVGFLGMLGIIMVGNVITSAITIGGLRSGSIYDADDRRYKRIRNDIIRGLRTSSLPPEAYVDLIKTLDHMAEIISKARTESDNVGVIDAFFRKISGTGRLLANNKALDQLVEDLMENELHVAALRVKEARK